MWWARNRNIEVISEGSNEIQLQATSQLDIERSEESDSNRSDEIQLQATSQLDIERSEESDSNRSNEIQLQATSQLDIERSEESDSNRSNEIQLQAISQLNSDCSGKGESFLESLRTKLVAGKRKRCREKGTGLFISTENWRKHLKCSWPGTVHCCGRQFERPGAYEYHLVKIHVRNKRYKLG